MTSDCAPHQGGIDEAIVQRIATDDELTCQPFFWSAAGMKLFGGSRLDRATLKPLLMDAASQQPIIVAAFLEQVRGACPGLPWLALRGLPPTAADAAHHFQ